MSKTRKNVLAASGIPTGQHRAHLVRGHFKVRKSGVFWWMPFVRGNQKLGFVHKHYEVKP